LSRACRRDALEWTARQFQSPPRRSGAEIMADEKIEVGYQAYVSDGGEEFGAVREVRPHGRPEIVIYVENAGDFYVPLDAIESVHAEKVILNCARLDRRLRQAIGHAHDAEEPGL
jgi:hypothetical protein